MDQLVFSTVVMVTCERASECEYCLSTWSVFQIVVAQYFYLSHYLLSVSSCRLSADTAPLLLPADRSSTNWRPSEAGCWWKTTHWGTELLTSFLSLSLSLDPVVSWVTFRKRRSQQGHFLSEWPHPCWVSSLFLSLCSNCWVHLHKCSRVFREADRNNK